MSLTNIEPTIILDLYDHDTTPSTIKVIQLDSNTRYVAAAIRDRGETYDIGANTGVTLTVIRPDRTGVQITGSPRAQSEFTPGGEEVVTYGAYAELSQAALAVKGTLRAQFMFTSGDQILRTEIFSINCGEALDASTSEWTGEYQGYNLDELVQTVNTTVATVSDLKTAFTKKVTPTVDLRKFAFGTSTQYIQASGALSDSAKWVAYWLKVSDIGKIIRAESYGNVITYKQVAFYSSETPSASSFISGISFTSTSAKTISNNVSIPSGAVLCIFANRNESGTDVVFDGTDATAIYNYPKDAFEKYNGKMRMIGYSKVNNQYDYVINTAEMYNYVGQNAYDGIKGDIRITSDNVLVMCHDAGFTLDGNGEIVDFDSSNYTAIRNLTFAEVQNLVFAQQTTGDADMHVPTFDEYVSICKKWGKFCFPTIRDEFMDIVLPLMFSTLDKYNMRGNTIVNSMTYDSLVALRTIDKEIPISYTINVQSSNLNLAAVKNISMLGNCVLGFFATNAASTSVDTLASKISANATYLSLLKSSGIHIYGGIAAKKHLETYLNNGFDAVHTVDNWEE